jgi:hypothetical protein
VEHHLFHLIDGRAASPPSRSSSLSGDGDGAVGLRGVGSSAGGWLLWRWWPSWSRPRYQYSYRRWDRRHCEVLTLTTGPQLPAFNFCYFVGSGSLAINRQRT